MKLYNFKDVLNTQNYYRPKVGFRVKSKVIIIVCFSANGAARETNGRRWSTSLHQKIRRILYYLTPRVRLGHFRSPNDFTGFFGRFSPCGAAEQGWARQVQRRAARSCDGRKEKKTTSENYAINNYYCHRSSNARADRKRSSMDYTY